MALVADADYIGAEIQSLSARIELERRLPNEVVDRLIAGGLFRQCVPLSIGGLESEAATLLQSIESIARADGSAGWCTMIGATSGLISAYLPIDAAAQVYRHETVTGGVFAPLGRATVVPGGYRVDGRWAFASGCQHCTWLMGGCIVLEDGKPQLATNGLPDPRLMLFPAAAVEIIDTWDVSGLRGTGSHDIAVRDLFVPAELSVSLVSDKPRHDGPLYRFPAFGLLALGIAAVALGIARRAIDELIDLAGAKSPAGSRRRLAERGAVQTDVAQAEATVRSARALLFDSVGEAWGSAVAGRALSATERASVRLAATHATTAAATAVDRMYNAGGGTAIYAKSPLQRCFRDVHVATQHMMIAPPTWELTGKLLLGLDADTSQL